MIILYLLSISCILFDNKEFSNFLDEKLSKDNLSSKEETEKMGLDKLIDNINTAESIKSMTSSDLAPKQGGSQGEEKTQSGSKQSDTKKQTGGEKKDQAGGEKKDQAGGEKKGQAGAEKKDQSGEDKNVTVQPIKVKDKDAVLVKSEEGGNSPSIIVIADQELMKNEEELKKLPNEISGHEENTKEGEQKSKSTGKEGEQKPQAGGKGSDQKPQAGGKGSDQKPQAGGKGGEQKPQAGGKGGEQKPQAGGKGGEQKPQAGGKGSPLLKLNSEESTQEGLLLKDKLDTSLFESNKNSESYITVLYKNKPRSVKIGVKTFTIIESLSPENKAKSATEEVSDKTLQSTQKISKEADKKQKEKVEEDKKKVEEAKKKEDKKQKEKVEEDKKKEDEKKKEDKKKKEKVEEVKKKEDDKKKEDEAKKNEKKQDKDKKKENEKKKEDKDKNSETEKKVEEAKKKVEDTKNKKSGDETKNKKLGEETKKEGNIEKVIEKSKEEIKKDAEKNKNEIKKGLNENKEEIKKSKQNKEETKKELEKKSTKSENDEKKTSKEPKDIKYETPDFESNKKAESEGIWSSIFNASNDTKRLNSEKSKVKSKDNSESKKALESVVFDGDGKDLKSINQKKSENASTEQNSASIDDLLYVIKNMPGKVNINKEGKKIFIEGDFKAPNSKDEKNNEFKFSGVIKSKASN